MVETNPVAAGCMALLRQHCPRGTGAGTVPFWGVASGRAPRLTPACCRDHRHPVSGMAMRADRAVTLILAHHPALPGSQKGRRGPYRGLEAGKGGRVKAQGRPFPDSRGREPSAGVRPVLCGRRFLQPVAGVCDGLAGPTLHPGPRAITEAASRVQGPKPQNGCRGWGAVLGGTPLAWLRPWALWLLPAWPSAVPLGVGASVPGSVT